MAPVTAKCMSAFPCFARPCVAARAWLYRKREVGATRKVTGRKGYGLRRDRSAQDGSTENEPIAMGSPRIPLDKALAMTATLDADSALLLQPLSAVQQPRHPPYNQDQGNAVTHRLSASGLEQRQIT